MGLIVISQSWSSLGQMLASCLKADLVKITIDQFADLEVTVSFQHLEKVKNNNILLVYQLFAPKISSLYRIERSSINDQLMALLQAIDFLKSAGASSIQLLVPYLPYSRQDLAQDKKLPGAVYMLGKCLKALGVTAVFACDLHEPGIVESFGLPLHNIDLAQFWAQTISTNFIRQNNPESYCIVSPDNGGRERAQKIAALCGISFAYMQKVRVDSDMPQVDALVGEVRGKQVILVDDIVDTARTAIGACDLLIKNGANRVFGCFSHAVLSAGAAQRLSESRFEKVLVTNTVKINSTQSFDKLGTVFIADYICQRISTGLVKS